MSKLALLVSVGAPLALLPGDARAADPVPPPAAAPAAAPPVPAPAAAVAAPAAALPPPPPPPVIPPPVPAAPPAAVAPGAPAVAAGPVGADGSVQIHLTAKELVTLEHRTGPEAPWQHGCETPCDVRLPGADEFRIVGEGVNESEPFSLTTPKGDVVKIHVAPGIKSRAKAGEVLTFTGAVLFVGAVVVGIGASDPGRTFPANGATDNYNWNVIAVGTGVAVVGLVSGILGGAWWYDNSQTRVAGDVQAGQPARGDIEPRYQTGMRTVAPAMPTYSASIFSTSF